MSLLLILLSKSKEEHSFQVQGHLEL